MVKRVWAVLQDLLPLLPVGAQRYFVFYMISTTLVTLLDVIAVSMLAIIIGPAITGGSLDIPIIGEITPEMAPVVALTALVLILVKSILSVSLHWHATRRFAKYELEIGDRGELREPVSDAHRHRLAGPAAVVVPGGDPVAHGAIIGDTQRHHVRSPPGRGVGGTSPAGAAGVLVARGA